MCLHSAARDLHAEFRGIFSDETIRTLLFDSYAELAASATVTWWLVLGAEQLARERLQAVAHTRIGDGKTPAVLFVSAHNAGRSLMAVGWLTHLAPDRAVAWSAGPEPVLEIDPAVVAVMAEAGIDISGEFSRPWTDEFVLAADVIVTMGCGCPLLPGRHYQDWELDDPAGRTLAEIRSIRDEIRHQVTKLIAVLPEARPARQTVAANLPV